MKVGEYDVTMSNIRSFFVGTTLKTLDDMGVGMPEYRKAQVQLRAYLCQECTIAGKCKACNCTTPDMYYDPKKEDKLGRWGKMMKEDQWIKFLNDNQNSDIQKLAMAYSRYYQQEEPIEDDTDDTPVNTTYTIDLPSELMTVEYPVYDVDCSIETTFEFQNTTSKAVRVVSIAPSCNCALAHFYVDGIPSGSGVVVKPKSVMSIGLQYNAKANELVNRAVSVKLDNAQELVFTIKSK